MLIVKNNELDSDTIQTLLQHPFYISRDHKEQTLFFDSEDPKTDFQKKVLEVARRYMSEACPGYQIKEVETWAQDLKEGGMLAPHCDHNCRYTIDLSAKLNLPTTGEWLFKVPEHHITSPITMALYLDVSEDLKGGEFVLSDRSWKDEPQPLNLPVYRLVDSSRTILTPKTGDVVLFRGSFYYHWIEKVMRGHRRSLLINFWSGETLINTL